MNKFYFLSSLVGIVGLYMLLFFHISWATYLVSASLGLIAGASLSEPARRQKRRS